MASPCAKDFVWAKNLQIEWRVEMWCHILVNILSLDSIKLESFAFLCRLPAPNQMFSISVMTDIKSDRPVTYDDLNVVIKKAIKNHALGDLTVKENGYSLTVVKGNFILRYNFCFGKNVDCELCTMFGWLINYSQKLCFQNSLSSACDHFIIYLVLFLFFLIFVMHLILFVLVYIFILCGRNCKYELSKQCQSWSSSNGKRTEKSKFS